MSDVTATRISESDLLLIQTVADEHTRFATERLRDAMADLRDVGVKEQLIGAVAVHLGLSALINIFGREEVVAVLGQLGPYVADGRIGAEG